MTRLNPAEGAARKDEGIAKVARANRRFLTAIRAVAVRISEKQGSVTVDPLRVHADLMGWAPTHPNAWGAVFHTRGWKRLDVMTPSAYPSNHARRNPHWRWVGEGGESA